MANEVTLHRFLSRQYALLARGATIRFSAIAPSRLSWYRFRARKGGYRKIGGRSALVVEVEADSFFIRMFSKTLVFYFDAAHHNMIGYQGMVLVKDTEGENFDVRITFSEPPDLAPVQGKNRSTK